MTRPHWETVWTDRPADQLSWHQQHASTSLALIMGSVSDHDTPIIDVGGGDSPLAHELLAAGYRNLTVLDVAEAAIAQAKRRMGPDSEAITWLTHDVTSFVPQRQYQLWHDRAVFHFLIEPAEQRRYAESAAASVAPEGWLIIATFAHDGPEQCSGLPVCRHTQDSLTDALIIGFVPVDFTTETHVSPAGVELRFLYGRFRRAADPRRSTVR